MARDLTIFPEDDIGDMLWQFELAGADLNDIVEVEFSVIFPSEELALKFGQILLENNQKLSFCSYEGDEENPWEITAYPSMPLNYENIISYQALLVSTSAPLKGQYDGWYCAAMERFIENNDTDTGLLNS